MKYVFSKHADEQITKRNISRTIVDNVIANPGKIIMYDNCTKVFQSIIDEKENKYLYRVFVNICKNPALIITAYKTSKIEKYEDKI
jgi:hypothetical protein